VQNNPLLIHPLEETSSNPLKFDYVVYVCLDAIDSVILEQADKGASLLNVFHCYATHQQVPRLELSLCSWTLRKNLRNWRWDVHAVALQCPGMFESVLVAAGAVELRSSGVSV
jgi:hypothetical protein